MSLECHYNVIIRIYVKGHFDDVYIPFVILFCVIDADWTCHWGPGTGVTTLHVFD